MQDVEDGILQPVTTYKEILKLCVYMVPQLLSLGDWGNWRMVVGRVSRLCLRDKRGIMLTKLC